MSSLEISDQEAAAVQKTPNRVTLDYIKSRIKSVEYIRPETVSTLTIAVLTYENGFTFTGESACADPGNFDADLGKKFALEDATRKIWAFEGFALRERLSQA